MLQKALCQGQVLMCPVDSTEYEINEPASSQWNTSSYVKSDENHFQQQTSTFFGSSVADIETLLLSLPRNLNKHELEKNNSKSNHPNQQQSGDLEVLDEEDEYNEDETYVEKKLEIAWQYRYKRILQNTIIFSTNTTSALSRSYYVPLFLI